MSDAQKAAEKLRTAVLDNTPAPWDVGGMQNTHVYGNGETDNGYRFFVADTTHSTDHDGSRGDVEAAYIALMHPPVALALANLLDALDDLYADISQTSDLQLYVDYLTAAILRK